MDIKGTILRAKDGHPVPVLEREGLKRHLGSMYDGAVAASCWCEKVASKRTENIILFGMGDCRIVLELIEKVPGQILIYEPESFVFSQMRTSNLYKKAVKCRRVKIFQASECAKFSCVAKDLLDDDWVEETMLAVHPGYVDWYEEEFLKVQEICQKICDDITFMRAPLKRFTVAMIRNQIANFPNMTKGVPLKRLYRRENADIPIILVSAGPSLEKNVEDLKEAKGHALIWCADAALPTMLSHQVIPDLVASVDAGKDLACFADERSNQIPVLGSSNTRTEFLKRNTAVDNTTGEVSNYRTAGTQNMMYQINFSQTLVVNTEGCDSINLAVGRTISDITNICNDLDVMEANLKSVEKRINDCDENDKTTLANLNELKSQIKTEIQLQKTVLGKTLGSAITTCQSAKDELNVALADHGSRYNRMSMTKSKLEQQQNDTKEAKSDNEDADLGEAYVNFSEADLLYQATLNATSKILGQSLLNFI